MSFYAREIVAAWFYTTPSTAKGGAISAFLPMVSHHDHSEHSVKIIITEHGIADLRGKSPIQRAHEIIPNQSLDCNPFQFRM